MVVSKGCNVLCTVMTKFGRFRDSTKSPSEVKGLELSGNLQLVLKSQGPNFDGPIERKIGLDGIVRWFREICLLLLDGKQMLADEIEADERSPDGGGRVLGKWGRHLLPVRILSQIFKQNESKLIFLV